MPCDNCGDSDPSHFYPNKSKRFCKSCHCSKLKSDRQLSPSVTLSSRVDSLESHVSSLDDDFSDLKDFFRTNYVPFDSLPRIINSYTDNLFDRFEKELSQRDHLINDLQNRLSQQDLLISQLQQRLPPPPIIPTLPTFPKIAITPGSVPRR